MSILPLLISGVLVLLLVKNPGRPSQLKRGGDQGLHAQPPHKLEGIYQATLFAQEHGFRKVHFESDNEKVIQMLLGQREDQESYLGYLICSIRSLLHTFNSYKFSHVRRNGNVVANCLAQIATMGPNRIWIGEVPIEAQSLYFHDFVS